MVAIQSIIGFYIGLIVESKQLSIWNRVKMSYSFKQKSVGL